MKRIYFLAPNIGIAHKIVDELHAEGIEDHHINILAKRDTPLEGMHEAGMSIKTDFVPAIERGLALGGTTGLLMGLIALRFSGFVIAGGPILSIVIAGATIGSLAGGLLGMNVGNTKLKKFESAIEYGSLLVVVDVPRDQVQGIKQLITKHHPDAELEDLEPACAQ